MLRPVEQYDYPQIRQWAAKDHCKEYFRRYPPVFTWPENLNGWFTHTYVIRNDDTPVGLIQLANHDALNKKVELGFMVDKDLYPKRAKIAVEACIVVLDYVFNCLGYDKVYCLGLANRPNLAVLSAAYGFKHEGTLRENLFWDGKMQDECVYGLLKREYII